MSDYGMEQRGGGRGPLWIGLAVVLVAVAMIVGAMIGNRSRSPGALATHAPLKVVSSIGPLTWPVRELAPAAEITVLTPAGGSPHGMEVTASQIRAIAEADVVLLVGLGLDDAARRAVKEHPRDGRQVVVLEDSLDLAGVAPITHSPAGSAAGKQGASQEIQDPHAWLDPMVMRVFVGRVSSALTRASGSAVTGAMLLQQRCDGIDRTYRIALGTLPQRDMVCEHNAYGYLAARFGLTIVGVLQPVESGEVAPGDLKKVVDAIRAHRIGAIFVEPGGPSAAAERVAQATGVKLLTLDPLDDGDWPELMNDNLEMLLDGLSARVPAPPPAPAGGGSDTSGATPPAGSGASSGSSGG